MQGDESSLEGAKALVERVKSYWRAKGYAGIRAWPEPAVERVYSTDAAGNVIWQARRFYHVRSNIGAAGFPPA